MPLLMQLSILRLCFILSAKHNVANLHRMTPSFRCAWMSCQLAPGCNVTFKQINHDVCTGNLKAGFEVSNSVRVGAYSI